MPSIAVVGDLLVDVVTSVPQATGSDLLNNLYARNTISLSPGGTATNVALFAKEIGFYPVTVIGKLGTDQLDDDLAAKYIKQCLDQHSIKHILLRDLSTATGTCVIVYLSNGARLMVTDLAANATLSKEDLSVEIVEQIGRSEILYLFGYSLLQEIQRQSTTYLLALAREMGMTIIFDLLPHEIYRYFTWNDLEQILYGVNILISELNTLRRLYAHASDEDTMARLLTIYKALIITQSNGQQQSFHDSQGYTKSYNTGFDPDHPNSKRGFLDRTALKIIYENYGRLAYQR